mgnify:CR=1 FL=1
MVGTYGIAKIDVASVTDANVQYERDTDLGINLTQQIPQAVIGTTNMTQGPIKKYPTGIINTGTAGDIVVKDTVGNTVVLGAMQPGVVRKFAFSQVLGAGTGPAVGEVTILY